MEIIAFPALPPLTGSPPWPQSTGAPPGGRAGAPPAAPFAADGASAPEGENLRQVAGAVAEGQHAFANQSAYQARSSIKPARATTAARW